MGEICWAQNKKRRAIKFFRKAVKINPEYPVPYFFLGKIYFAERKPEKGREQFSLFEKKMESFLAGDGSASDYYTARLHDICYLYATQKWYQKTKRICRKIIKLDPDDPKAHYNMAVCYYIHDNSRSRAYNELVKVKELAPDTRIADKAEFYIDYIRCNPDSRIIGDFTFLDED